MFKQCAARLFAVFQFADVVFVICVVSTFSYMFNLSGVLFRCILLCRIAVSLMYMKQVIFLKMTSSWTAVAWYGFLHSVISDCGIHYRLHSVVYPHVWSVSSSALSLAVAALKSFVLNISMMVFHVMCSLSTISGQNASVRHKMAHNSRTLGGN